MLGQQYQKDVSKNGCLGDLNNNLRTSALHHSQHLDDVTATAPSAFSPVLPNVG